METRQLVSGFLGQHAHILLRQETDGDGRVRTWGICKTYLSGAIPAPAGARPCLDCARVAGEVR